MAYTEGSSWNASLEQRKLWMLKIDPATDWSVNPIILLKGVTGITGIDSVALISTVALTDGTNPLSFTVELHYTDIMNPVTDDTKLLNNIMPAPLTSVTGDTYKTVDLGRHSFMPIMALAPKRPSSPSLQADIAAGRTVYDVVLRSNAKAAQTSGEIFLRVWYYQYLGPDFYPGTQASCCTVGYTPATN